MAKKQSPGKATNRQGRSNTEHRFLKIYHYMLKSEAWKHLSGDGWKVVTELMSRHNGKNNGQIPLSVREVAALLRSGNTKALSALREAQEKGFIERIFPGEIGTTAKAAEWRLTMFADGSGLETKEYMSWRPLEKVKI